MRLFPVNMVGYRQVERWVIACLYICDYFCDYFCVGFSFSSSRFQEVRVCHNWEATVLENKVLLRIKSNQFGRNSNSSTVSLGM